MAPEPTDEEEAFRTRVADRIRATAERKDISLRELAQRANVSRGHLWAVLGGKSAASTDLLARLAKALDVDSDVLIGRPRKPRSPSK